MLKPLLTPNVPQKKVKVVAVSDFSEDLIDKLDSLNVDSIITVKSNFLDDKVNYHTDMLIMNFDKRTIFIDESQNSNFVKFLTKGYNLKIINQAVKSPYPADSLLNCIVLGKRIICNTGTVSSEILAAAKESDYKIIDVKQGYSKCSVCAINNNALITDDESIYKSSQLNQIDSILISKGSVRLKGFDYGFIGGCTGLIDKNKLLFNGDINYHKDCDRILDFLSKYNIEPIIIENRPIIDIGSIIPICEEIP